MKYDQHLEETDSVFTELVTDGEYSSVTGPWGLVGWRQGPHNGRFYAFGVAGAHRAIELGTMLVEMGRAVEDALRERNAAPVAELAPNPDPDGSLSAPVEVPVQGDGDPEIAITLADANRFRTVDSYSDGMYGWVKVTDIDTGNTRRESWCVDSKNATSQHDAWEAAVVVLMAMENAAPKPAA
jgi:hypothetical protein